MIGWTKRLVQFPTMNSEPVGEDFGSFSQADHRIGERMAGETPHRFLELDEVQGLLG